MTALVLSAGGMFCAWQAGAWKFLSERFRPDIVVGASGGAMNGWAIAGGASAQDLIGEWLDSRTASVMRLRLGGFGLFDPRPLRAKASDMFQRYQPRVPFGATLVEVPRLRLRLVRGEEMDWRHLVATCAVPCAFPPVRLEGRWYVDGGFLGALPLWAAAEMGATRVLALDALPRMPSALVRGTVAMARCIGTVRQTPPGLPVQRIQPGVELGTVRDAMFWRESNVRRWIDQGEHDAQSSYSPAL